jgi:catalase
MTKDRSKPTTTDAGIPVTSDEHSLTIGPDGPILLQDHYLIEQMANFNGSAFRSSSHTPKDLAHSVTSR